MACTNVEGSYVEGMLLISGTETALIDPIVRLGPVSNGAFTGKFDGGGEINFNGTCSNDGPQPTIVFTRIQQQQQITTVYTGRVIRVPALNKVIIRGTFTRVTPRLNADAELVASTVNGDWETERPT
jgi:hypothetical protein